MEEHKYRFLDGIDSPADLKGLAVADLEVLCAEVRDYMVRCCAENPGHLASSLGAVEIITALHYVYDTPADKIVFDVGHQAYAHKILTGRREAFRTNRTRDGISGFPVRSESPYDAFGVGHASTSVSAALGLAEAARLRGSGEKTVAVIGDGALTGGLAFEGLNNAGGGSADLLVLINDNNQSIDKNLGGLHNHLLSLTTSPFYNRVKDKVWRTLGESRTRNFFQRWIRTTKSWIVGRSGGDLFESLGFRYFGPIDGNDIGEVVDALRRIRGLKGPRVLHCLTTKGHGYAAAEADPTTWHAPGRFDPETGQRKVTSYGRDRYQDVFGEVLLELARADARVVGITPAMASGCGMNRLAAAMPERFFDVGIEEEHAVTFASGLAAAGIRPFCNIYSAFSQRAYDQLIHDVALQRLPVVLCLDRAGLVGEDGATHQGAFDLAAFRSIPNCTVVAPRDEYELRCAMHAALRSAEGPYIIRYPRGLGEGVAWADKPVRDYPAGRGERLVEGHSRLAVLALGPFAYRAEEAARKFEAEGGKTPSVYDVRFLKPMDLDLLETVAAEADTVLTVEDGALKGGLMGEVAEYMASHHPGIRVEGIGIPDRFVAHAAQREQREAFGLTAEGILGRMRELSQKD
ncbi:MAG: 1-deoxy-D-xylulose-5-phosphate synthase [Bacteroidales bacterium]|nr:1-deoxy-D-xylulose-5-phosphate synthase [Bacteroidales bacterium]